MKDTTKLSNFDMRSAGVDGQYTIRVKIAQMLEQGTTGNQIAKTLSVSSTLVYFVRDRYREKGMEGLKIGQRGRRQGTKRKLTLEQEEDIQNVILNTTPDEHGFQECLWTRKNICTLIQEKYGVELKLSTAGLYLQRWEYTAQRPTKRNYKQDPAEVRKWLEETYPAVCERARKENAEIFFGDETNIRNTTAYMKGYAPINHPPVVKVSCNRGPKINMVSAIANRGALRFMLYRENMTSSLFIDFMRRLVYDRFKNPIAKKVFLIIDNYSVHTASPVKAWAERHKEDIELFYLPRYAPEYNPDELINSGIKRGIGMKSWSKNNEELEHKVRSRLFDYQRNSQLVMGCFGTPTTRYAGPIDFLVNTPITTPVSELDIISI